MISSGIMLWIMFSSGWRMHEFLYPVIGVVACAGLGYAFSLALPTRPRPLDGLTVYTMKKRFGG